VITNVCNEIIEETNCGIIVDFSADSFRRALLELAEFPKLREKLGENGREWFGKKYNWAAQERKLLKLYASFFG